ncbi:DUF4399 domain-containing protein [Thalassotalea piscium]|uniref:Putative NAD(P)/FAD-binding protein YdhS n=1 Tax=Thalassotalea piscium TaxID=1230533 RepID=A0A7X0NEW8_9GAMM|nr:DUF4399 domain-containing protein [Thalassotalea piscium]MBB6542031.1 putative NAD(P)/FAD-binding protein YdhS [Thalassotalea piscium]
MKKYISPLLFALLFTPIGAFANNTASIISTAPENAEVYFIQPQDGQTVSQKLKVVFGLKNMGVAPAGTDRENTGHHHILIDTDTLPDLSQPLPATDKIIHFGGGQTETEITLSPGKHTLQLVLGNHAHIPHSKPVISKKITVTVK